MNYVSLGVLEITDIVFVYFNKDCLSNQISISYLYLHRIYVLSISISFIYKEFMSVLYYTIIAWWRVQYKDLLHDEKLYCTRQRRVQYNFSECNKSLLLHEPTML